MIYLVIDRENLLIEGTALGFTAAKLTTRVTYAKVQVQAAPLRVTEDGTDPVPATPIGEIFYPLDSFEVWGKSALNAFRAIRETGASGRIEVTYLGTGA